jgi:lipopolysaccharide assembly outer membrane protein LptD (OstA)
VVDPPLLLEGPTLTWDANTNIVTAPYPFRIVQTEQDLRVRADKGEWNVEKQQISLEGEVRARDKQAGLEVNTARAIWEITNQIVQLPEALDATSSDRGFNVVADQGMVF